MTSLARRLQGATSPYPSAVLVGAQQDLTPGGTTYTFAGISFGTRQHQARRVVVFVAGVETSVSRSISSVTIGGVAATIHQSVGGVTYPVAIASAPASITTGDVVVTFSGAMSTGCRILVFELVDFRDTSPSGASGTSTGTTVSATRSVTNNEVLIAAAASSLAMASATWSGASEVYDDGSPGTGLTGAIRAGGAANSSSRDVTWSGAGTSRILAIAWR